MSSGVVLVASAARTTSSNSGTLSDLVGLTSRAKSATLYLSVTADEQTAADKLDVYVQSSVDGGTTWDDFGHFAQQAGNGGATGVKSVMTWQRDVSDDEERAPQDAAIAAATVVQGPLGALWRVKWVIVNDSGSASFTFSVRARIEVR